MATARLLKKQGKLTKPNNRRLKGNRDKFVGNQRTSIVRKSNNLFLKEKAYVDPNDLYQPPEKIEDTFEFKYVLENESNKMIRTGRAKPITKGRLKGDTFEVDALGPHYTKNGKAILHPGAERAMTIEEAIKRSRPFYRQTDLISTAIRANILSRSEEQGKRMQSVYDIANKPYIDSQGRAMQGLYGVGTPQLTKNPTFVKQNKSPWALPTKSQSFKQSVITKCINRGADLEVINRLEAMDADKLMEMFNMGLFGEIEQYFDYDDDYDDSQGFVSKIGNTDALEIIEKYEAYYGTD